MRKVENRISFKRVRTSEHFLFNLTEFLIFKDSEQGLAFPFGRTKIFAILSVIPYTLIAEIIFFRTQRYFIMISENLAGVLAILSEEDTIFINTIGVRRTFRRQGIAHFALERVARLAVDQDKKRLELSVLKKNTPAQRLYSEFGFKRKSETIWSLVLQKDGAVA